jgi:type IV pilus assembly protein PilA
MKKYLLLATCAGAVVLGTTSCAKKEAPAAAAPKPETVKVTTAEVVKEQERSAHFMAVNRQLELGGTLYGYVDIDGDVEKVAGILNDVMGKIAATQPAAAPYLKQDYAALLTMMGLTDIKAAGFSSVPDGTGFFRNRTFFHTPEGRHGLLAGLGGKPAPFARLGLAPADTDVYFESEIDLPVVYATVREIVAKVSGDKAAETMEEQLKRKTEKMAFSMYSLIQGLKGRTALVMRLDGEKVMRFPGARGQVITVPAISMLLCLDGVAPVVESTLAQSPFFKASHEGAMHLYELAMPLPVEGFKPLFVVEGTSLYFATSREFLQECRGASAGGLAQRAEFKTALAHVGAEGNALGYVSPRFFDQLRRIESLNPMIPVESKPVFDLVLRSLPKPDRPLVTVRRNLPDGILVSSYWNRSLKQDIATLAIYNPISLGVMAAMAIPAFQKVRTSSQEKAVMNNLRQFAAAADQYYLENNVTTVRYDDLVGPDKYIRRMTPVGGEDYRSLVLKQGQPLRIQVPVLKKTIEYAP